MDGREVVHAFFIFYHVSVSSHIRWDNFGIFYGLKFKGKCNDKRID